jgi:hypothetical protein
MAILRGFRVVVVLLFSVVFASTAGANQTGVSGRTTLSGGAGCASCHGATAGGVNVTVRTIPGTSTSMFPGQIGSFVIEIAKTVGTSTARVGYNIRTSSGTVLATEPTSQYTIDSREIHHNSTFAALRTLSTGTTTYAFDWQMPDATIGSTHTLAGVAAAGHADNLNLVGWAHAADLIVTCVRPADPTNLMETAVGYSSISLSWSGTGPNYRLLRKAGSFPTSPTDGTILYEGSGTSATASGLSPSTTYYFAVYGRYATTFSQNASQRSVTTATLQTWYVNSNSGNDTNAGNNSTAPFKTITKALTVAIPQDVISVAAGSYNVASGETFPLTLTSGVRLLSQSGVLSTIIDAAGANQRVINCHSADDQTILQGFTIRGGRATAPTYVGYTVGGGIFCNSNCSAIIRGNFITDNQALGAAGSSSSPAGGEANGGGIYVTGNARVENNVLTNNVARGGDGLDRNGVQGNGGAGGSALGGGLFGISFAPETINNTFYGNSAIGGEGGLATQATFVGGNGGPAQGGGGFAWYHKFVNNIFASNTALGGAGGSGPTAGSGGTGQDGGMFCADLPRNNLFHANSPNSATTPGPASVTADPKFTNPAGDDFHLARSSPARGAGSSTGAPTTDMEAFPRRTPPAIGALEGYAKRLELHGDFNGDNRDDVLFVDGASNLGVWLMNGATITGGGLVSSTGGLAVVGIGDLNGDGKADIVLQNTTTGDVRCWIMNGTTITSSHAVGSPGAYTVAAVADFSGDGKADILLRDSLGNIGMWIMNGHLITAGALVGSPGAYTVAAVADFNGDAKADILLRDGLGSVGMWMMNGSTIAAGAFVGSPGAYTVAGAADFDNDGRADILLRDTVGNLGMWMMNGATITSGSFVGWPGGYAANSVGDYNGDNRADILLRHEASGDVGMWMMNGSLIISGGFVSGVSVAYEVY